MLTPDLAKKITSFVALKPRTVQEIALHISRNWRTADAYVEKIAAEQGVLGVRTFRSGTRGALKVVYWNSADSVKGSAVQERLFEEIRKSRSKQDFSPFEIYQYAVHKEAFLEDQEDEPSTVVQPLIDTLRSAAKQVLIFSGNFSWAHLTAGKESLLDILGDLSSRGVNVKVLCDIDLFALENMEKALAFNKRLGGNAIEYRHCSQPLRGFVIDDRIVRFKEKKLSKRLAKKQTFIFYTIRDADWAEWTAKVFWSFFSGSISASERIKELKSIQKIGRLG